MRKKGFTLVELLVVIAIIAMLLAILMPALAKVKTLAYQMLCGTNLKGIANAILVYGQDNNEKYPVAGLSGVVWNNTGGNQPVGSLYGNNNQWQWDNPDKGQMKAKATVSSCLYLLVKYADVSPASFVCKASKQKKLKLTDIQLGTDTNEKGTPNTSSQAKDPTECWDFSNCPSRYCSYAYAYPWDSSRVPTSASKSGLAIAGDLNPWIQGDTSISFVSAASGNEAPQMIVFNTKSTWSTGNSLTHEQAGQNILFNDMHVEFSKQPNPDSAIQNDNVYVPWETTFGTNEIAKRQKGKQPVNTGNSDSTMKPQSKEDSYLVQW